ncbi:hypothetical protein NEOLEDRAFT_646317 [Neolentinus lepideus HHB14362 ss-1]|uniref:Uncharacterized protein n=1 Tax=Neolentinus lepideus HHB14362 ss-1 TaxID=1314782 RepID=A0A165QHQ0_9AGAM|nr:hypothetical protein NEOLEDRAFT_646317 [Neolentinus lepideus HHB14362 ss-1]
MREYRFLFRKTWQEFYSEAEVWNPRDPERQLILDQPPPNHVRIDWYPSLEAIGEWDSSLKCIVTDFPLDPSGSLDLTMIKKYWFMDEVIPVDPIRWRPFEPANPDKLSALAIHNLTENGGVLKIIDRPSPKTRKMRALRLRVISCARSVESWLAHPLFSLLVVLLCFALWWQLYIFAYESLPFPPGREPYSAIFVRRVRRIMGRGT